MSRLRAVLAACGVLVGSSAFGASPDPKDLVVPPEELSKARELVRQLGNEGYREREQAQAELAKMGRLARQVLTEAVVSDADPEVRHRVSRLLPKANALDLQARIDTFLADKGGRYDHDLPGWNQFRAVVRNDFKLLGHTFPGNRELDRAAREVFVGLIEHPDNRRLVVAAARPTSEFRSLVSDRRIELYNRKYGRVPGVPRKDPTLEEMTALLFAESLVPSVFGARATSISPLISTSGFTAAARDDDPKGRVYRAVAGAWLVSRTDPRDMYYALTIASNLGMKDELYRVSARLLCAKGATASYRGRGATFLVNAGYAKYLRLVEPAMGDAAVVYTDRLSVLNDGKPEAKAYGVQARDMALAVSVLLSGQELEDYGFRDRYTGNAGGRSYAYTRYYFPDDAARDAAFEKWKEWREENPDE